MKARQGVALPNMEPVVVTADDMTPVPRDGATVDAVERAIEDRIPAEFQLHAHHWLILHGRYKCKARKPGCPTCLINDLCAFEEKTI